MSQAEISEQTIVHKGGNNTKDGVTSSAKLACDKHLILKTLAWQTHLGSAKSNYIKKTLWL